MVPINKQMLNKAVIPIKKLGSELKSIYVKPVTTGRVTIIVEVASQVSNAMLEKAHW